jgi:hypothetical protein
MKVEAWAIFTELTYANLSSFAVREWVLAMIVRSVQGDHVVPKAGSARQRV